VSGSVFGKCPTCQTPVPAIVRVMSDSEQKVPTDLIVQCVCYACEGAFDVTLKLGNRAELQKRMS
jgi:hypothetical protein